MRPVTWSSGVLRVVAALIVESITSVWTSRSWNRPSNFDIVPEICISIGIQRFSHTVSTLGTKCLTELFMLQSTYSTKGSLCYALKQT